MLGVTDYGAFVVAFLILLAIPGPGNFALITATGKGGVKGGLAATLGVILGDQVLMWLAVAGVATLLAAYPAAFHVVQWAGAAYLAWLGLRMVLSKPGTAARESRMAGGHYLRQTMMITLLNPKAIMFYMAFFPLFVDPVRHQGVVTFAFMAVTVAALTFLYGLIAVLLTHYLAERVRANPRVSNLLERLAGACLVGFGIKLAAMR
ncbi:LysE family transporter [Pseudomonas putida]|uniref:LysE family transporter n=1 Tax=Pseudomonas putida TaxID=303 RepID=UPI001C213740|nr:LysE family transporter [Pseudomonas putida]